MTKLSLMALNQFQKFFRTLTIKIWIIAVIVILLVLLFSSVEYSEKGVIWSILGRELPHFEIMLLPMIVQVIHYFGLFVFVPIGLSAGIHASMSPETVNYYLSRPVSRTQVVLGHLLGVFSGSMMLSAASISSLLLVTAYKSGLWFFSLYKFMLIFLPAFFTVYAFLVLVIFATRSVGFGTVVYLLYVFMVGKYLHFRSAESGLVDKASNLVMTLLEHTLPPVSGLMVFSPMISIELDWSVIAISAWSLILLTSLSVLRYSRFEF